MVEEIDSDKNEVGKPYRTIDVVSESGTVAGVIAGYCWSETADECQLTPENPKELIMDESALVVDEAEEIAVYVTYSNEDERDPYRVEVFQYGYQDEDGKVVDSETALRQTTFSAPEEKGNYFYLVHVIWDEEETQQVHYAFRSAVR